MNDTSLVTTPYGTYPVHANWLAIGPCITRWQRLRWRARNQVRRTNVVALFPG